MDRVAQETARQRDSIGLWLVRLGLTLNHTFEDTGSRDLAVKRPGFQRLLKAVAEGELRHARNLEDAERARVALLTSLMKLRAAERARMKRGI